MSKKERKKIVLSQERIDSGLAIGVLVPVGRFDHERVLKRCQFRSTSTKLVMYTASTFADLGTGSNIHPGNELLAITAGISTRTVIREVKTLREAGLIFQVTRGSSLGRSAKASVYRLTLPERLAEAYAMEWTAWDDEKNGYVWDEREQWDIAALLEALDDLQSHEHVTPVSSDNREHVTPTSPDLVAEIKEHVTTVQEQVTPATRTSDPHVTPSTYVSNQDSSNHHHLASRNKGNPATDSPHAANDESETSIEEAYQQAYAKLSALPDNGVELMAKVEADQPELNLRQRVITAAERAPKRRGKNAA